MAEKIKGLTSKLQLLPDKPGVYLMKGRNGSIIYIGKAKILKHRLRTYFTGIPADQKTRELVSQISDFDYIITNSEVEALILESNLIKKHRPKYNIMLKDDKQYPLIKITLTEPFPRVLVTRKLEQDGSRYFGPYTDVRAVRKTLRLLEWIFTYRTCQRQIPADKVVFQRACINHQLGKCPAPCLGKISQADYLRQIRLIISFLQGRNQEVIRELKADMETMSGNCEFERAAVIRDQIRDISKLNNFHRLLFSDEKDRDVVGIYQEGTRAAVSVLKVLSGKLLNKEIYDLENAEDRSSGELIAAFLQQYYHEKQSELPYRILLQTRPEEYELLNSYFHNRLRIPRQGELYSLVKIARENAFNYLEEKKLSHLRKSSRTVYPVTELKEKLGLKRLPRRIICIDISTIQGTDTVSSLVCFMNGKPRKSLYRHYLIRSVQGQDDYAAMAETLERYLTGISREEEPDLIVLDGGKGQLSTAWKILEKRERTDLEMISLAKRLEEVFQPGSSESIILPRNSAALRLLISIRDEAHRFAVNYHRQRRSSRTLASELDQIKGVGEKTKFLLLREFGSVENIRQAEPAEITRIKGIGPDLAARIQRELKAV